MNEVIERKIQEQDKQINKLQLAIIRLEQLKQSHEHHKMMLERERDGKQNEF